MSRSAKGVILDLLSTLGSRALPARAFVAAGAILGVGENPIRVALARLVAAGTVERTDHGGYRLGAGAVAVQSQVRSWRRLEERVRAWDGSWIAVHVGGLARSDRASVRRRERALRFLGFRELEAGLDVRPANLAGGARRVREELLALGLDAGALVFALDDLDPATDARARELWNGEALAATYRASVRELEESAAHLPALDSAKAMVESFVLGGRVIRELVLDPLLPEPIVDVAARRALAEAMIRYDRLGRAAWRDFLRDYGVTGRGAPVEIGWSAPGDRLLHA